MRIAHESHPPNFHATPLRRDRSNIAQFFSSSTESFEKVIHMLGTLPIILPAMILPVRSMICSPCILVFIFLVDLTVAREDGATFPPAGGKVALEFGPD